jgi:hypothetical protein
MFPVLGLIAAGVTSALTAGEAAVIAASVGAATAIGTNATIDIASQYARQRKKKQIVSENDKTSDTDIDDEEIKAAIELAFKIVKKAQKDKYNYGE